MSAQEDVNGLLAGASKTMAGARSCWLVTSTGDGGVDARPTQVGERRSIMTNARMRRR